MLLQVQAESTRRQKAREAAVGLPPALVHGLGLLQDPPLAEISLSRGPRPPLQLEDLMELLQAVEAAAASRFHLAHQEEHEVARGLDPEEELDSEVVRLRAEVAELRCERLLPPPV